MTDELNAGSGAVFDIQSYSVHDGPGCRTTVFLAGCFLKCRWCANPESWNFSEQLMFASSKCRHREGCTKCIRVCGRQGLFAADGEIRLDRQKCLSCKDFACAGACPTEALKVCGRRYTADELMAVICRDRDFWGPGGGVTFGGGEPFYQKDFLATVVRRCKEAGLHTAIETTAHVATPDFLATMAWIDFAFIDAKNMDSLKHREQTGVGNELILKNIAALARSGWSGRLVLRMPVIRDFNDSWKNIAAVADFMDELGLYEINILPFHRLGDSKWAQLGRRYPYKDHEPTAPGTMEEIQNYFLARKIACYSGSDTPF
jgi:pyruvate formate lyase activating enzyme